MTDPTPRRPRPLRGPGVARTDGAGLDTFTEGGPSDADPAPALKPLAARVFAWTCTCLLGLIVLTLLAGGLWRAIVWAWLG